jgi:Skp family chaperone for outer membrane proteins
MGLFNKKQNKKPAARPAQRRPNANTMSEVLRRTGNAAIGSAFGPVGTAVGALLPNRRQQMPSRQPARTPAVSGSWQGPVRPTQRPSTSNAWATPRPAAAPRPATTSSNPLLAFDTSVGLDIPNGINDRDQLARFYQQEYDDLGATYDELRDYQLDELRAMREQANASMEAYLADSEANLQQDRDTLDNNEAQSGTLFSTGRTQRRQSLQDTYNRDIANRRSGLANSLSNAARGVEQNVGSRAMRNMNFDLANGTADAQALRPGVGVNTGLSSAYSASNNYLGNLPRQRVTEATQRAANRLSRRNNSALPGFYTMN